MAGRGGSFNAQSDHAKHGNYVNPNVQMGKAPKRVVHRPAFGSGSPKSGLEFGFRAGDRHAEERSPERRSPEIGKNNAPSTEYSVVAVAGKSARRGRRRPGGPGKHTPERREERGGTFSKGIKSPRSPPNLQRTSSHHIQSGWSPAVIRGTSVTAHTHTSSSTVLAHTHRTMTGMANASEEELGHSANSGQLFQRELRS